MMSLRSKTFAASRWTSVSTIVGMALQILQTAILARLLLPADFGLMAVASAAIAVLMLVVDLGLSQAVIHFDNMLINNRSSLYWLNGLLAATLAISLALSAPYWSHLYGSPALAELLRWSSLIFPFTAAGQQLRALAARDLRFNIISINELLSALVGLGSAVGAALSGAGVYALVIGPLATALSNSLLAWLTLPTHYRPTLHFRLSEIRPYLNFGGYLVGESFANNLSRNADIFLGSLIVGADRIGFYSLPRNLSLNGATLINSIVTKVGFPVMSRIKHEPEKLKLVFLQTLRMTASINFPLYIALALFSREIVSLLFGDQWQEAAEYLRILAIWGLLRSTGNPIGSLIYACGQTKRAFWWNVSLLVIFPPLIWIAAREGALLGLSLAMLGLHLMVFLPAWRLLVYPCCGASLREYLKQFASPLVCALASGLFAWIASSFVSHDFLRLLAGCTLGGSMYLALSWHLNKQWVTSMGELLHLKKFT